MSLMTYEMFVLVQAYTSVQAPETPIELHTNKIGYAAHILHCCNLVGATTMHVSHVDFSHA